MTRNQEKALVSVVVPCYNHGLFVQETILSIIAQDYENIELIIIDDGSEDNSIEKIQELIPSCQKRFKRFEFRYRENKGLSTTLNEALAWSKGEFFAPIASDDIMFPTKTQTQVNYMIQNQYCGGVFGGAVILAKNGQRVVNRKLKYKRYQFKDIITNRYAIFSPSQLLRRSVLCSVGGYKAGVILEDWFIYLKISYEGYTLDALPDIMIGYRRHEKNMSNNLSLMHEERDRILAEYTDNKYYEISLVEKEYTKSIDLLPYNKKESFFRFFKVILKKPKLIFRVSTLKFLVKIFVRKKILIKRLYGG